jgi:hypothetical protein
MEIASFIPIPGSAGELPDRGIVRGEMDSPILAPHLSAFLGEFLKARHGERVTKTGNEMSVRLRDFFKRLFKGRNHESNGLERI